MQRWACVRAGLGSVRHRHRARGNPGIDGRSIPAVAPSGEEPRTFAPRAYTAAAFAATPVAAGAEAEKGIGPAMPLVSAAGS